MELSVTNDLQVHMKRDGRLLGHDTLEEMRVLAVQRVKEGERPADVAASFGMHQSWAFKCRAAGSRRGNGVRALRSTKGSGRARKLSGQWERQVFRWVNGKNPQQYGFGHFVNFSGTEHWPDEDRRWGLAATVPCKKIDLMDAK